MRIICGDVREFCQHNQRLRASANDPPSPMAGWHGSCDSAHIASTETPFPEKRFGGVARSGVVLPSSYWREGLYQALPYRETDTGLHGECAILDVVTSLIN